MPNGSGLENLVMWPRVIACELGWPDLVAATVLRTVHSPPTGDLVDASLQVIWPDCLPDAAPDLFLDGDV